MNTNTSLPTNQQLSDVLKPLLVALSPEDQSFRSMQIEMELGHDGNLVFDFSVWISRWQRIVTGKSPEAVQLLIASFDPEAALKKEISDLEQRLKQLKGAGKVVVA